MSNLCITFANRCIARETDNDEIGLRVADVSNICLIQG